MGEKPAGKLSEDFPVFHLDKKFFFGYNKKR